MTLGGLPSRHYGATFALASPDGEPVAHAHELKDLDKLPLEELTRLYERATRAHN